MPNDRVDNRKDVLLLLLYSPGKTERVNEPISGRTRLVKMLFLFREEVLKDFRKGTEITEENFYEFFPWNFGPFSTQVHDDLDFFILHGFIEAQPSREETLPESAAEWEMWLNSSRADSSDDPVAEYEEQEFQLSPKGLAFARTLYDLLSGAQQRLLKQFKKKLVSIPLRGLLKYVYDKYEVYATKSRIQERITG